MSLFRGISDKIVARRQRAREEKEFQRKRASDKQEFLASIVSAAEHGRVTDEEMTEIQARYKALGLSRDDLKGVRAEAYDVALCAAKKRGAVTAAAEADLVRLERFLSIPEAEIASQKRELARLRLLSEIQVGNLPSISVRGLVLQKDEIAHWSEPASIYEERVMQRRYEGGSQGVSVRVAKRVTVRVGGHRGHIVTDKAVVPVSSGALIITNKRIIFLGDTKSFTIRLDKLLECQVLDDSGRVRLTDDKGKAREVTLRQNENTEVVKAIMSYAINHAR
jgi:hypothetical protein